MGFAADITKQVRKDMSMHFVYPPGVPIKLGDIMQLDDGIWTPVGNLFDDYGIPFDEATDVVDDLTPGNFQTSSEHGFDMEFKAAGEPGGAFKYVTDANAGVRVTFNSARSFALGLSGVRFIRLRNFENTWSDIKQTHGNLHLRRGTRIVTRVAVAESATFLASADAGAAFELEATADVKVAPVSIADLAVGFKLVSSMKARTQFAGLGPITALFSAYKIGWFGGVKPAAADDTIENLGVVEEDVNDLELDS